MSKWSSEGKQNLRGTSSVGNGKELAYMRRMRSMLMLARTLWQKEPCRVLSAAIFAALVGIAAGKTVLHTYGSVSVVDGSSMEPTYYPLARVLTTPISTPLVRGDIVRVDDGREECALKRIVGLPGDKLTIWRGYVFINKRLLHEPYLPKYTYTFPDQLAHTFVFVLGPDDYFVMGDNRTESCDSRAYGPVDRKAIKGRVPLPETYERPSLMAYTLPAPGKRTIREL